MSIYIDESQRKAAKVVGITYLLAMATSMFAEGYVRGTLIVFDNAAVTAQNIMENNLLFRIGIAAEFLTFISDLALISSLYVILAPVNRHLALFAVFTRIAAESVCIVMAAGSLEVLRLLSGSDYLKPFETEKLYSMARLYIGAHGALYNVAFIFLGLGSTVFAYLWFKSNYIPRIWAFLGLIASPLLAVASFVFVLFPKLWLVIYPAYMIPMFFFEVGLGVWLLIKGLKPPTV